MQYKKSFFLWRFNSFSDQWQLKQIVAKISFFGCSRTEFSEIFMKGFIVKDSCWIQWTQFPNGEAENNLRSEEGFVKHETLFISIKILDNAIDQESETQNWVFDAVVQGNFAGLHSISVFEMFDVWYGFVEIIPLLKDWSRTRYLFRDVS